MILAFNANQVVAKGILVFMTVFCYGSLLYRYRPYKKKKHNQVELASSAIAAITLILGVLLYNNKDIFLSFLAIFLIGIEILYYYYIDYVNLL